MRCLALFLAVGLTATLPVTVGAQVPAPIPSGKRFVAYFSCNDMKTRVVYDHRDDRLFLDWAAKRIVMMLQPGTGDVRHFISRSQHLDWAQQGNTAALSSMQAGAESKLADCRRIQ